jgi:pyridoxal phosphate enzyme (YggS family)
MDQDQELSLKANIANVKERIRKAALQAGRDPAGIDLIAVTKDKPAVVVKILAENGITRIGENYLQEAEFKIEILQDLEIEWHMIGNIQQDKEKKIAFMFDVVHSVSSGKIAQELSRHAGEIGSKLPIYLEINTSGESTKFGWTVSDQESIQNLASEFEEILGLPALDVQGLMTMAPYSRNPEDSRPYYKQMREIRDALHTLLPGSSFPGLSMGMSGDFEVAIDEGATVVRIGTALVGPR